MKKKSLVKTLLGVGTAVMMLGAMTVGVNAGTLYKDGSYTASVNLYVPKANAPQGLVDAYLNDNTHIPPSNPSSNNMTVAIKDDVITVSKLSIANPQFGIKAFANSALTANDTSKEVKATLGGAEAVSCSTTSHAGTRYTTFDATITPSESETSLNYTFSDCALHARITKTLLGSIEITAYDKNFEAPVVLSVKLPSDSLATATN